MTWLYFILVGVVVLALISWALDKPPPPDSEFDDDWP
jgi:hypothetical protein